MTPISDKQLWQQIIDQVSLEWRQLPDAERAWITEHALKIAGLQRELHRYFLEIGGAEICRDCDGSCCGHGRFHPTLTNLLVCLTLDVPLPEPDFSKGCPYIGKEGCLFPPESRPYNCISFVCEQIEEQFAASIHAEFYRLEQEIRQEYERFAARYVGAGLRGLLIRDERLPAYLARQRSSD